MIRLLYLLALLVLGAVLGCSSGRESDAAVAEIDAASSGVTVPPPDGMVVIPRGQLRKAEVEVEIDPFFLDAYEVTNDDFAGFVEATEYVSEAEQWGWSLVFVPEVGEDPESEVRVPGTPWWLKVDGAYWADPRGDGEPLPGKLPAVQVSWNDATAYCGWRGARLPTEAEWQWAAQGGDEQRPYPWGDTRRPDGSWRANVWQGEFPVEHTVEDGFEGLAPVGSFAPNEYGLYDMAGNVWEWIADWYQPGAFLTRSESNPRGPAQGGERVLRGGSWLCAANYCEGYRTTHRNHSAPDSGLDNTGFRCAKSLESSTQRLG